MQILLGEVRKQLSTSSVKSTPRKNKKIIPFKPILSTLGVAAAVVLGFLVFKGDPSVEPSGPGAVAQNEIDAMPQGGAIVLAFNGVAQVSELDGNEKTDFRTLEDGDLLEPGMELKTGAESEAVLLLTNGSLATLGPDSQMRLAEFTQKAFEGTEEKVSELTDEPSESHVLLELDLGELVVEVKKLDKQSSFDLYSHLGFAGIRGTQYRALATDRSVRLSVLEGKVAVSKERGGLDHLIESERAILLEEDLQKEPDGATVEEIERIKRVNERARKLAEKVKLKDLAEAYDEINKRLALALKEKELEQALNQAIDEGTYIVESAANMEMIWCKPGSFMMGDNDKVEVQKNPYSGKKSPSHKVTFTKGFFLGKYEVTQEQFEKIMGKNPSEFKDKKHPVERVTWKDAVAFCEILTANEKKVGWKFSLPTEAQWEYACRAGTNTKYSWGDTIIPEMANYGASALKKTMLVGSYRSNAWGFFDMHGNVYEWCADWFKNYPSGPRTDPKGPSSGSLKVIRGGAWRRIGDSAMSAHREYRKPEQYRYNDLGFRVCLMQVKEEVKQASIPDKVNLSEGLAGWWKFDETKGKIAKDSSGKNRNGELKNFDSDTAQWVKGPVGNAISLDGKNDYIDVGDFEWGGEFSFSAWVKYKKFQNWSRVFDFGVKAENNDIYLTNGKSQSNKFHLTVRAKSVNGLHLENVLDSNTWYHLAFSLDSKGYLTAYSQGKIIAPQKRIVPAKKMMRKNQFLGKSQFEKDAYLNGILDDFRIYDRAINEFEIKALFALGDPPKLVNVLAKEKDSVGKEGAIEQKDDKSFSADLLAAVKNWKVIPKSVFPLSNVTIQKEVEVENYSRDGKVISKSNLSVGRQVVVLGHKGGLLTISPSRTSLSRGSIKIEDTDFKNSVAALFELRKKQREVYADRKKLNDSEIQKKPNYIVKSALNMELIWCKPGNFVMGSPKNEKGRGTDETMHQVILTEGFYLGKYEVTQGQYEKVMGKNPSKFKGKKLPVEVVSWNDAMEFCKRLTGLEKKEGRVPDGWNYVLPTEAQWEYACRAGTATAYSWGNDISSARANYNWDRGPMDGADFKKTRDVGQYAANPWGLFDMHGNVLEWTNDWEANYPRGEVTNPKGRASGSLRVNRGGSWNGVGSHLRSAERGSITPGFRISFIGFRVGFQSSK